MLIVVGSTFPLAAMSTDVEIEVYPKRPITLVVGFPPGDGADIIARHLAMYMSNDLGQRVIVENRPGAGGNIAAASVARAKADGYTIFVAARPIALHKTLYREVDYDFSRDFTPVGIIVSVPYVLVMGKHVAATTLQEAFAQATRNPGAMTCGSGGIGTTSHLLCEELREKAGLPWVHVPYAGNAAALLDVAGGRVDFAVVSVPAALPFIKADTVRTMAVLGRDKVSVIPSVPGLDKFGIRNIHDQSWCAVVAPTGTPTHAIARLNRSINAALSNAEVRKKIVGLGYVLPSGRNTAEALEVFIDEDTEKWTDILRERQVGQTVP
nr:tripartite tricarboxylate transporter substrate binding protein [Bordetella sp. LUAb4]